MNACAIILFPLNYFFQFLYYTDVGSTFFCLLAYYYNLKAKHNYSLAFGIISILFRQTNIIWIGFFFMLCILNEINKMIKEPKSKNSNKSSLANVSNIFQLLAVQSNEFSSLLTSKTFYMKVFTEDLSFKKRLLLKNLIHIFNSTSSFKPYFIQIIAFLTFVYYNNGIAVGDRSNHEASFHICQLLYFSVFTVGLLFLSHFFQSFKNCFKLIKTAFFRNFILFSVSLVLLNLIVSKFTYEHKFLLADNRHYTFYIWSKVFKRHHLMRYLLSPVYYFCIFCIYKLLITNHKTFGWIVAYTVCLCACIIPQKLVEFRYFIIPYLIFRLNIKSHSVKFVFIEIILYSLINSVTIYLFLYKTFYWDSSDEVQRFMW